RVDVVVRRQPPQLTGSLQSVRDRPDPLQVLALASRRIIDFVDILDHRRGPLPSVPPLLRAPAARGHGPSEPGAWQERDARRRPAAVPPRAPRPPPGARIARRPSGIAAMTIVGQ